MSHAAPRPNSVDLSEPQASRIANAFASAPGIYPECTRSGGKPSRDPSNSTPHRLPVLLIQSNVDLRGVSGLWFAFHILALPQRLISFSSARLSPLPSACRVHIFTPGSCCCRFLWRLATSTDPSTFALQIATCAELLPSLREFMAIRAVSPALALGPVLWSSVILLPRNCAHFVARGPVTHELPSLRLCLCLCLSITRVVL